MTKERFNEIKTIITEKANYYFNIGFVNLSNDYANLGNFLAEMENILKENEELKTKIQNLEKEELERFSQINSIKNEVYD